MPNLLPYDSWDRLQPHHDPKLANRKRMDGKDMMFLYILVPIRVMLCLVSKHQDADG